MARKSIGEFLSGLRRANGFTQREVADKLNVSNRTLSSWETDRTIPDVLILPALADLYGVTVDEILRGERRDERLTEISDGAKRSARKNRYGKFITKLFLFGLLAFMGSVLIAVGGILTLYSNSPLWLDIIILVIGAACAVVFSALVFYFRHATACAEGIILKEDLSGDNEAFILNVKNKTALFLAVLSLPLLICGIIIGLLLIFDPPLYFTYGSLVYLVRYLRVGFLCAYIAVALILLVCAVVLYCRNISKLGNDTQIQTHRYNTKLLAKTCGFGVILPVILAIIWVVLHFTCRYGVNVLYAEKDFGKFKEERETLTVGVDLISTDGTEHSLQAGTYKLNFPSVGFDGQTPLYCDLGEGFWGEIKTVGYTETNGCVVATSYDTYCTVYYNPSVTDVSQIGEYGLYGEEAPHGLYINTYLYEYILDKQFVTADMISYGTTTYYSVWGEQTISERWGYEDGYYGLIEYTTNDFNAFAGGIFLSGTIASVTVYSIVFAVIRKKQNYNF